MTEDTLKYMDIEEFRGEGLLQEANRLFFHPLGLALEVNYDDDGNVVLGGIWDFRDDPEGMYFDIANRSEEDQEDMKDKALHVQSKLIAKAQERTKKFNGVVVEPIPNMNG